MSAAAMCRVGGYDISLDVRYEEVHDGVQARLLRTRPIDAAD